MERKMRGKQNRLAQLRLCPSYEAIAKRAYELWLDRGCPFGDELHDWLGAEEELLREPGTGRYRHGSYMPREDVQSIR